MIGTNLAPAVRLVCWRQVNSPYLSGKTRLQTSFVGEMIDHRQQFGGEVIALLTNCYLSHWVEHACVWISSFDCGIILKYYDENHAHVVLFLPNWTHWQTTRGKHKTTRLRLVVLCLPIVVCQLVQFGAIFISWWTRKPTRLTPRWFSCPPLAEYLEKQHSK